MRYKTNQQLNGKTLLVASIKPLVHGVRITGTMTEGNETFTHDFGSGQAAKQLLNLTVPTKIRIDLAGRHTNLTVLRHNSNPMDTACPELIFEGIDTNFNTLITTPEGWKFWDHQTPPWSDGRPGSIERVQFCRRIGRKKDVFECINVNEWHNCPHTPKTPQTSKPPNTERSGH